MNFNLRFNGYREEDFGGRSYNITARVSSYGKTESGNKYILDSVNLGNKDFNTRYKIALYVYGESRLDIGDKISFSATLKSNEVIYENSLSVYNLEEGIRYTANAEATEIIVIDNDKTVFESVNVAIRDGLSSGLNQEEFSIAYALLTGNSADMDDELLSNFRKAGVAHIFAVSGLHIGFVASVLFFILKKCKIKGYYKLAIVGLVLIFYSGVCLFTASAIRATVMCIVLMASQCMGKKYDPLTSLSLASIIVLMISPTQLFCAGFGLSFGVVLGILLFNRPIKRLLRFLPNKISSAVAVGVASQLTAIPISLVFFNQFSAISIIINIIFIPFVSVLFVSLILGLIVGGIFGIAYESLFLSGQGLWLTRTLIGAFDYSVFMVGGFLIGGSALLYFGGLAVTSGIINLRRITKIISVVLLSICMVGEITYLNVSNGRSMNIAVVGDDRITATVVMDNGDGTLIVNSAERYFGVSRIERATERYYGDIDSVIFPSGRGIDISEVLTKLKGKYNIDEVYYRRERTVLTSSQLQKAFPDVTFTEIYDGMKIANGKSEITLKADGYLCEITRTIGGYSFTFAVLSQIQGNLDIFYQLENSFYDVMVVSDHVERIEGVSGCDEIISYTEYATYENAEIKGNYYLSKG